MSFRKSKSILIEASTKALELVKRLWRDSLILRSEIIPMFDYIIADYLMVKKFIDVE